MEQHDISTHDADPQETIDRLAAELAAEQERNRVWGVTLDTANRTIAALECQNMALRSAGLADALRDGIAIARKWAARWKHLARLYHRLWQDAQGVAMAQGDVAGELGAELADCHARCGSLAYTVRALAAERAAAAEVEG